MQRCKRPGAVLSALLVFNALAWVVLAGPLLPQNRKLPDRLRSLALIGRLQLVVEPFPAELEDLGVKRDEVENLWRDRLKESGYELTYTRDAPLLRLRAVAIREDLVKGAVAYLPALELEQAVSIEGIEGKVILPTFRFDYLGLETDEKLPEAASRVLRLLLEEFIASQRAAAAER